ncbi:MAG: tetratricopeptide repeat protein [Planctomycetota bacterium]
MMDAKRDRRILAAKPRHAKTRVPLNGTFRIALLFTTAVLGLAGQAFTQSYDNDAANLRSVMTPEVDAAQVQNRLQALLESTRKARRDRTRREEANALSSGKPIPMSNGQPPQPETSGPGGFNGGELQSPGTNDRSSDLATQSTQSLDEIRERIRILQRLKRDRQLMDRAARDQAPVDPGLVVTPQVPMEVGNNTPELDAQVGPALDRADEVDAGGNVSTDTPATTSPASLTGSQILPKPANAFALGQSLYRTGNYESALKSFRTAEKLSMTPSEKTWLELMIALCEHRLGRSGEATGLLRDIANMKSSDYPIKVATWWLQHAEATGETEAKWQTLSSDLDLLSERINGNDQP